MPEVRRAADRYRTVGDGVETFHSFSFGRHYDPDNVGFGPVMAINEERLAPGAGYDDHHHSDAEIVTWVLEGELRHEDSTGTRGLIRPGVAQRLSAGAGVTHAERNASTTEPLRFVQMMVRSSNEGEPEYAQVGVPDGPGLHPAVEVNGPARLLVAQLDEGVALGVAVPAQVLVHVTAGEVEIDGTTLLPGDDWREDRPGEVILTGRAGSQALVWVV